MCACTAHVAPTSDTDRGVQQSAFRLWVTQGGPADHSSVVWDTGIRASNGTRLVAYNGTAPLESDTLYTWAVQSWDGHGELANSTAAFRTGLFSRADWSTAIWITPGFGRSLLRSPPLRVPPGGVTEATVSVAGVGYFELTVNGKRVGKGRKYDVAWCGN